MDTPVNTASAETGGFEPVFTERSCIVALSEGPLRKMVS